MNICFRICYRN